VFQSDIGEFCLGDHKFILRILTIELNPPIADGSFGSAYHFDANVLATLTLNVGKDAFLLFAEFLDNV